MSLYFKRLISLLILAVVAVACSTTPTGRKQLVLKSDAELEAEGTRQMMLIRENSPLVKNQATIDYVACVAEAIVAEVEGRHADLYWELAIVDQPDVNAHVLPGGKMVVKAGILGVTQNQHQLAAVLGHEVAHVTANHANERASRATVAGFGIETLAIILGGGYRNQTAGAYDALSTAGALGIMNPFSRMQETESDLIGLKYMAKAGFDPRESVQLWQNMLASTKTKIPEYMSTHPSGDTRIDNLLNEMADALKLYNEAKAMGKEPNCGP